MNPWDDLPFSDEDRRNYAKAGMGAKLEPGDAPAIVIVDMNYSFTDSRFPLGSSDAAGPALTAIGRLLEVARPLRVPILFTTTFNTPHQAVRGLWKGAGGDVNDAMLSLEEAHAINAAIAPRSDEPVLAKAKPSAFWQTGLADVLQFHRADTLIVCGMSTSGCVRATVIDAFSHNLRVLVPSECVADRGQLSHKVNLFDMHMKYAEVVTLDRVVEYLQSVCTRTQVMHATDNVEMETPT
jgi:nicotinamidase-related amidase